MAIGAIAYRVDRDDRILSVNEGWSRFAAENDAERLKGKAVLGISLWDFITDTAVRDLHALMLERVRSERTVRYRFRCDAPGKCRLFEMTMAPGAEGGVSFCSELVSEENRPSLPLLDPKSSRNGLFLKVCSWCHAMAQPDGSWSSLEEVAAGLQGEAAVPALTHGICGACEAEMRRELVAS
jgi:hypothetical protein